MYKAGRYTAALLLIVVGGTLLADKMLQTNWLVLLLHFWPVVIIVLGIEYLLFTFYLRKRSEGLRLGVGSVMLSVLISAAVIVFSQASGSPLSLSAIKETLNLEQLVSRFSQLDGENGYRFEKEKQSIVISELTERIEVENPNGNLTIRKSDSSQLELEVVVFVDRYVEEEEARSIASGSKVSIETGSNVRLRAEPQQYGHDNRRKPRMNMTLYVPPHIAADYESQLSNGSLTVSDVTVRDLLLTETQNGELSLSDIRGGNIEARTTNGNIFVLHTEGSIQLETRNGKIEAEGIKGAAELSTTNGSIMVSEVTGDVTAETVNGWIQAEQLSKSVNLQTRNGKITATSDRVGGNWEVDSSNGSLEIGVPVEGHFTIRAEAHGNLSIDPSFPLKVQRGEAEGTIGNGEFEINLETSSEISIVPAKIIDKLK
ncbi:DUF4097 family beta strand repeat-containing protein [Paenibacillus turpanensis]|uniref:DUF4097 family beta strand repeat-containing protein n=1 Tax=Paenibacillus turpanensis TaxID=2689078 RepID=UPI00140A48F2|nr:DUF4097 family beta strand repeat-containing protein [Paenibacillus turpanensis]